jgi:hypothetical protein
MSKWRDEFAIASLGALVVNIVRQLYAKEGTKVEFVDPTDLMVDWAGVREEELGTEKVQSLEEQKQILMQIAHIFGAKKPDK